jgi:maltose alpha-D-glucosyltransferase / alpha-amylase
MKEDIALGILRECWEGLYGKDAESQFLGFVNELIAKKNELHLEEQSPEWSKDAIVYSLYVDLFNKDFPGLIQKLDYLRDLGVNCLWLLPILQSPMRDAGFDISNYKEIRSDLLGAGNENKQEVFIEFLNEAHKRNIRVIFDIALNHTSDQHPWFQESRKSVQNPYRDYYIWNQDSEKYKEARLLFKGMCPSNWEKDGDCFYFHRFFEFQPDLNYRNPQVLIALVKKLLFWLGKGADGFRADAIPYLWKEDGTDCENLPKTHTIVRFFRAALDFVRPNTLLLAEACQKPKEVVKYLETEDECNAGYHFPLMPQIFKALAMQSKEPVQMTLSPEITPQIPASSQWFTFLRCHDELSLELVYVSEEDRKYIHENYCHKKEWDFRLGEGISARLADLMQKDERKIALLYSIMLTLPGTPVIYYGDEFGKLNDEVYYHEMIRMTGKDDTRFLVRGKIDWAELNENLKDKDSFTSQVFSAISRLIKTRKQYKCFGRGSIEWLDAKNESGDILNGIMAYRRFSDKENILIVQNLSDKKQIVSFSDLNLTKRVVDILGNSTKLNVEKNGIVLKPYAYHWISL